MSLAYRQNCNQPENVYQSDKCGWTYQLCECCPYGYHIDLDFVRFCESINDQGTQSETMIQRKERRRQRQSMEVLLGLATPLCSWSKEEALSQIEELNLSKEASRNSLQSTLVHNMLEDAVMDFEQAFKLSNPLTINNNNIDNSYDIVDVLNRVSSNSVISGSQKYSNMALTSEKIATTISEQFGPTDVDSTTGLSAVALKNIREQMALGLERMKELEENVKLIPALQVQVSILKEEKQKLLELLKAKHSDLLPTGINTCLVQNQQKCHASTKKNMGVMCSVITRNVGVDPQYPRTKSVSTTTLELSNSFSKCYKKNLLGISQSSQTIFPVCEQGVQTVSHTKHENNVNITVKSKLEDLPKHYINGHTADVILDKTFNENLCLKCSALKRSIGVGPVTYNDNHFSVSLKSMSLSRSKSFNLGEEHLKVNLKRRTIGCQSENFTFNKASQSEPKVATRSSQCEYKLCNNKGIQYESSTISQNTDTTDLNIKKDASCNTSNVLKLNVSSNTVTYLDGSKFKCLKCSEDSIRKEENLGTVSRIPRPSHVNTYLTEIKHVKKQNLCLEHNDVSQNSSDIDRRSSGLELLSNLTSEMELVTLPENRSISDDEQNSGFSNVEGSFIHSNNINEVDILREDKIDKLNSSDFPAIEICSSDEVLSRDKVRPTKEMRAAMKVLNDSLQKYKSVNMRSQVQSALNILQQEWFKVSSTKLANPLTVEDYLDCFEEISSTLLQFIVNITDESGNTAMHYAVSHANFDVVSILLDSKVCNINKINKAGYTSIMLVSLTKLYTTTHYTIVQRLFQLADVNIRAKQHGQTALMLAVSHGRLDMVQMLLEAGADINIQDEDGSTALMCAAEHGYIDIVKFFLSQSDCNSSIVDMDGSTALKIALEAGHKDVGVLLYTHEHSTHGISPHSSSLQRKSKNLAPTIKSTSQLQNPSLYHLEKKHAK